MDDEASHITSFFLVNEKKNVIGHDIQYRNIIVVNQLRCVSCQNFPSVYCEALMHSDV